jgi:hypothetical protein
MSTRAPGAPATSGQIYEESARQLARWRDRYRGQPDREQRRLWLLALEREQVVSIAYRESAIADRIARMPLAEEARDLIRHAMVWVWKDEEMHTAYIRGVVLHRGDPVLRAVAYGDDQPHLERRRPADRVLEAAHEPVRPRPPLALVARGAG